ncbi:MAG: hypothetical protein WBS16_02550 [Thermoplasmata archaeon]
MDLGTGATRTRHAALATAGTVLLAVLLNTSSVAGPGGASGTAPAAAAGDTPNLSVDPDRWWMPAGNDTPFTATWVGPAPNCTLAPLWYRWTVSGDPVGGTLAPAAGPVVNFSATSDATGPTVLVVRSEAVLACGPRDSAVFASAEANVTVVAPIGIENLSVGPGPVAPGGTAFVRGDLTGGEPPLVVRVAWGDGTNTSVVAPADGPFSIPHAFPEGRYAPSLTVRDSDGLFAEGLVGEVLTASPSLSVGIEARASATDVGLPVEFNATILHAPLLYETGWSCGNLSSTGASPGGDATDFSCTFPDPGPSAVVFDVLPPLLGSPVNATLEESVVPAPNLTVSPANRTGEVGQPSLLTFNITGGVPPFVLNWTESGSTLGGQFTVVDDGRAVLAIVPSEPGSLEVTAHLVDGDGLETTNATTGLEVDPALNVSVAVGRAPTPADTVLAVSGTVTAGGPPFLWVVVSATAPSNESVPAGTLDAVGSFAWSAAYGVEGGTALSVTIVDAEGDVSTATFDLEMISPFEGTAAASTGGPLGPGRFALDLSLVGGLPPFDVTVNASDGQGWNLTLPADGSTVRTFSSRDGGSLALVVGAVDRSAAALQWNLTVDIPAGPAPPGPTPWSSSTDLGSVLAAFAILAVAVAVVLRAVRRRRARPSPPPPPDPVAVLREIIEPSDGADRATVELLAEEAGVPLEVVRSTIDRLIAAGTILSDAGGDEEAISWSTTPVP